MSAARHAHTTATTTRSAAGLASGKAGVAADPVAAEKSAPTSRASERSAPRRGSNIWMKMLDPTKVECSFWIRYGATDGPSSSAVRCSIARLSCGSRSSEQ